MNEDPDPFIDGNACNCLSDTQSTILNTWTADSSSHILTINKEISFWVYGRFTPFLQCLSIPSCSQFPVVLINCINTVRLFPLIIIPPLSPELLQIVRIVMDTCATHLQAEGKRRLFPIRTKEKKHKVLFKKNPESLYLNLWIETTCFKTYDIIIVPGV